MINDTVTNDAASGLAAIGVDAELAGLITAAYIADTGDIEGAADTADLVEFYLTAVETAIQQDIDHHVEYVTTHDDSGSDYIVALLADGAASNENDIFRQIRLVATGRTEQGWVPYRFDDNVNYLSEKFGLDNDTGFAFFEKYRPEIISRMIDVAEPESGSIFSGGDRNNAVILDSWALQEIETQIDLDSIDDYLESAHSLRLPYGMVNRKTFFEQLKNRRSLCMDYSDGLRDARFEQLLCYEATDAVWLAVVSLAQLVEVVEEIKEQYGYTDTDTDSDDSE